MVANWPLEIEIAMGILPVPISVSSGHFALRYEVPKFLPRGGHLCMAVLTIADVHVYLLPSALLRVSHATRALLYACVTYIAHQ